MTMKDNTVIDSGGSEVMKKPKKAEPPRNYKVISTKQNLMHSLLLLKYIN
jgi:hypothetical protein